MTCTYDRERLSLYANDDLTLPDRREVEAHLETCAACRRVVDQYREGAAAISASFLHVAAPARRRRVRGPRWTLMTATAAAVLLVMVAAVPEARAGVAKVASQLFGWHSITVRQEPTVWPPMEPGGEPQVVDDATVSYDREMARTNVEPTDKLTTDSLAKAREYLGHGVALPPDLEGQEMYLYKIEDKQGSLVMVGLSEPNIGFWARYRPDGQFEQVSATYGSGFDVTTEETSLGGRPARIVTATQKSGKASVEIWLQDGNWVYEIHGYGRDLPKLLHMAASMD